ncbi:hypothetical protein CKO32_18300 [Afifella marina DSM 2698]|uniref:Uncharacterized protein n=2 Tax=Afifella marina TaxID=1080 RepID=A0A1G5MFW7_AFIMA|nr:hypothetical protein [Afifella marina DSM 2698]MBK1625541.1 hypothetical protein [Afifella marina]MBK5917335.1 hypothetical protein [Afifella marina]RAI23319.1 hypothetical protein CH311_00015 [Afifella marina DSM 2698]SCZ23521.1 hypothetical protein SAMN03080610_00550 [Afifella marina DSM 2698]
MIDEWRAEYERERYLRELPDVALKTRFDALIRNLWSTDAAGNVTPPRSFENRRGLLRLILHTMLEQMERAKLIFRDFDERELREVASADYLPPRLRSPFTGSPSCFAKFGKRPHIRAAFERGILRITPAAAYDDPSLNAAQADKELEHFSVTPNEHLMVRLYGLNAELEEVERPVHCKELFRTLMTRNFYVWCCSLGYDARLFQPFEAEAVLVVRNKEAFRARLHEAVKKQLPEAKSIDRPIQYYDNYTADYSQIIPIFSKNIRYLYQNEYRFAWLVPEGSSLSTFFVELGPLDGIAEIYEVI